MDVLVEPLLDSGRVSKLLGVEPATLAAWRKRCYGPPWYRIGKKIKYSEHDLRRWMSTQVGAAPSGRGSSGAHPDHGAVK